MSLALPRATMALRTTLLVVAGGVFAGSAHAAVDPADRQAVRDAYAATVLAGEGVDVAWNGSAQECRAGSESSTSRTATIASVNFFREMNRLAPVTIAGATVNAKAQAAALMFEANNNLSHTPGTSWRCYTAAGAEAAGRSNIALGIAGADTVSAYVEDAGTYNEAVGHRRWILYPRARVFGTGSTTRANALWVVSDTEGSRPTHDVVAWPPAGYVPWPLVFDKWSVSSNLAPDADYSAARVSVSVGGTSLTVRRLPVHDGYADNTLAFEPAIPAGLRSAGAETAFDVTVSNVLVDGRARTIQYRTTAIPVDVTDAPTGVDVTVDGRTAQVSWTPPASTSSPVTGYHVTIVDGLGRTVTTAGADAAATSLAVADLGDGTLRADVRTLMGDVTSAPTSHMFSVGTPTAGMTAGPLRGVRVLRTGTRSRVMRLSLRADARVSTVVQRWSSSRGGWTATRRIARRGFSAGVASMRIGRFSSGRYRVVVVTPRTATHAASRLAVRFRVR